MKVKLLEDVGTDEACLAGGRRNTGLVQREACDQIAPFKLTDLQTLRPHHVRAHGAADTPSAHSLEGGVILLVNFVGGDERAVEDERGARARVDAELAGDAVERLRR